MNKQGVLPLKVCTAIWDSQDSLQDAGEAAALEPIVIAAGDASGSHQRRLLGGSDANTGSANDVMCDGRVQVGASLPLPFDPLQAFGARGVMQVLQLGPLLASNAKFATTKENTPY